MTERKRLIVATGNPGKAKEIRRLLEAEVAVETLRDHPAIEMPPEDADTFEGNARIKAEHVAGLMGQVVLADDSGLAVDVLGGAPGVHSARYAPGSDSDRITKLLIALDGVRPEKRTARFVCAMVLAVPGAPSIVRSGTCEGRIGATPIGDGGFGYDPVFLIDGDGRTMAQLPAEEKNRISHRGRAIAAILPELRRVLGIN